MQQTASDAGVLHGRTGLDKVTGETPVISDFIDFGFYDPFWYKENAGMGKTKMVMWLGVSHQTRSLMSFWVLTPSCRVVSREICPEDYKLGTAGGNQHEVNDHI